MEKTTNMFTALLEAQKEMEPVRKDGRGNYGKYATLDGVISTVTETLNKHGIIVAQPLDVVDGVQVIKTVLIHPESGDTFPSLYKVVCKDMDDPQKIGGAITYGRRYSLLAILGLAPEDDDGTAASTPADRDSTPSRAYTASSEPIVAGDCEIPGCKNQVKDIAKSKKFNKNHVICFIHSTESNWEAILAGEEQEAIPYDQMPEELR